MGLLDTLRARAGAAKSKAGDFVQQHEDQIQRGLDKAARTVDSRTKGKYRGRIETGTGKAKETLGRFARKEAAGPGTTPPGDRSAPGPESGTGTGPQDGAGPAGTTPGG
ncbi:antitoxin [Streptomyces pactum]|uniref:Antitoxin n=1 Tax=Streptomyces pactum TaxID=68249 RepID=A0ABS0NQ63_9ACTN|nr:antitoxin [Streptomyces pactum]MBH5337342.1 antitoxin [Streptomyces pactum]